MALQNILVAIPCEKVMILIYNCSLRILLNSLKRGKFDMQIHQSKPQKHNIVSRLHCRADGINELNEKISLTDLERKSLRLCVTLLEECMHTHKHRNAQEKYQIK